MRAGVNFTTLAVFLILSVGTSLVAVQYLPTKPRYERRASTASNTDNTDLPLDMAQSALPGRPGNLTPDQETRLKELWVAVLEVFGVAPKAGALAVPGQESSSAPSSSPTSPAIGSDSPDLNKKKKSRLSWLGKHSDKDKGSDSNGTGDDESDKYGQTKEFKAALANMTPEQLRDAFWSMVKHDDPDALLLRFLRARKWNVHNALVMLVSTMHWRSQEMHVDDDIMVNGEETWLKRSKTATGPEQKDANDILSQLRVGKSFIHGLDKEGRPMTIVRARTHHPGQETEKSLEQFTVFVIETARMLLRPPVDTAVSFLTMLTITHLLTPSDYHL